MKILVADDEPHITLSLKYLFEGKNYSVIIAESGMEAIEKAKLYKPDLIILNILMPRESADAGHLQPDEGIRVCKVLKQDEITAHIPIIMLTVKAGAKDREAGEAAGADAYLTKPFNFYEVLKTVEITLAATRWKRS